MNLNTDDNMEYGTGNIEQKPEIRLFVVDDEAGFREPLIKRLKKRGFVPREADNGTACLAELERQPADVVVADVKMPGMDGLTLLRKIKAAHPKTEVILLTGQSSTADGVAGIKAGAFDYLSKPIEMDHLLEKIRQAHDKILGEAERQRIAEFKDRMQQQMAVTERLASLGTLAVGMAHEINNPLAIIQESAGWLRQLLNRKAFNGFPVKPDFEKALSKIETAIGRATRITHELLGFVKKPETVSSAVSIHQMMEETVDIIRREARHRDIRIETQIDPSLDDIWTDPYQLRQVLINLLTNALHATGSKGMIRLVAQDEGHWVQLKVEDTGIGIAKENMSKIFEPFFSTKGPGEGTGLGLFITHGILQRLGGEIAVESRLGHGTTVSVRLPKHHKRQTEEDTQDPFQLLDKMKEALYHDSDRSDHPHR